MGNWLFWVLILAIFFVPWEKDEFWQDVGYTLGTITAEYNRGLEDEIRESESRTSTENEGTSAQAENEGSVGTGDDYRILIK